MEEIKAPFTVKDYIRASFSLELPENAPQTRVKPRVSGILDCARLQGYSMSNTPRSNPEEENFGRNHQNVTNEIHREAEDVSVAIIQELGYIVADRQIELSEDYPLTGHPDGRLVRKDDAYWNYNDPEDKRVYYTDGKLEDGLVWGFEHKVIGYLRFVDIFRDGLFKAKPEYIAQSLLYGDALGWDAVLFVVLADDAAATKGQRTKNAKQPWASREDWNPKVQLIPVDLRPLKPLVPLLHKRAEGIAAAIAQGKLIQREHSGTKVFPCGYCDWQDRCNIDGNDGVEVEKGPFIH